LNHEEFVIIVMAGVRVMAGKGLKTVRDSGGIRIKQHRSLCLSHEL
jgi:hypothetical protein